jgi:nucleoside-diphosphate-sugar epimerase
MKILVIGGTRFFGIHMVRALIARDHDITIATRGNSSDSFGDSVKRIVFDRSDENSCVKAFSGNSYDVVIDKIAYSSNDVKRIAKAISCKRYIVMSSTAVYNPLHMNTKENDFVPENTMNELVWCERSDVDYGEGKRNVERTACKLLNDVPLVFVRYPFVVGEDDYTQRLRFYIEHILNNQPMNIDNLDCQMSFINSREAGEFISFLAEKEFTGPINGANVGTVSIKEMIDYVEKKTGKKAIIASDGESAPYNGTPANSIDVTEATKLGYDFTDIDEWIYELIDRILISNL